jgi:hypothetical protein
MRDFVFESGALTFYGVIVQSPDGSDVILAIRGTETAEEWWDDLTSLCSVAWSRPEKVGYGFDEIYKTLTVVRYGATAPAKGLARALGPPPPFAKQVANLVANLPQGQKKGRRVRLR